MKKAKKEKKKENEKGKVMELKNYGERRRRRY
jgi:hypothetical protein